MFLFGAQVPVVPHADSMSSHRQPRLCVCRQQKPSTLCPRPKMLTIRCCPLLLLYLLALTTSLTLGQHQQLRPPRIKEHPTSLIVRRHEPARLECKADGNPAPTIEWYKDNEKVQPTANRIALDNSLFFLHVISKKGKGGDTGTYHCLARNEVGKVRSHNATLEVAFLREEFTLPKGMSFNTKVALGDTAILECTPPRGRPEPIVSWTYQGEPVDLENGRFKMDGYNLVISDVTQNDEGRYQCIAKNMLGIRESPPAILKVLVKPYFIRPPEDIKAMSDEDVVFHCKVGGDPTPEIIWRRLEGKVPIGKSQILEDKALRIMHVRPSDEGTYICEVENSAGKISSSATLVVNSIPSFVLTPQNVQVSANKVARLECSATGNPQPMHFWSKEGTQVLMFPNRTYGKFNVSSDGTLIISNVEKEDEGFYICSAVSSEGSAQTRAYLSVLSLSDVPPPVIRMGASNQTLPVNTKAFLPCEVSRVPSASIKWYFNQDPIYNDTHYAITPNSLQIQNIQRMDSGIYTCVASNPSGSTSWSTKLIVESPRNPNIHFKKMPDPLMFPEPPSKPVKVNVTDTSITLSWQRLGSSGTSPHITSLIEGYSPDTKQGWVQIARQISSDVYTVNNLRPNTRYVFIVRAQNSHGVGYPSEISDEIRTLDLNNYPTYDEMDSSRTRMLLSDVTIRLKDARTLSSSSVKLFWSVHGNLDLIEGFYIRYQRTMSTTGNSFNMVTVFGGGTNSYTLTDLSKFAKYQFFIVPFFKNIEGKPSNSLSAITFEDIPSAPPYSISTKAINASCAVIEWTPPPEETRNGNILGYHLQIYENNTLLYANLTLNSSYNSIVLHNLSLESFYTIRALAFTAVGNGPFSHPIYLSMDSATMQEFEDIHLQPSYKGNFLFNPFWFYLFIAIILLIVAIILVRLLLIYTSKKSNKPIYEKANSLNENLSDNFPKYDSTSSKYSSCPDNNEYAEVNDLKNYTDQSDKGPVAYAMTPLIEKLSDNGSKHYDSAPIKTTFKPMNGDELATESLLGELRANSTNYNSEMLHAMNSGPRVGGHFQRFNKTVHYDHGGEERASKKLNSFTQRSFNLPPCQPKLGDYEVAADGSRISYDYENNDYERSSCNSNEYQLGNSRSSNISQNSYMMNDHTSNGSLLIDGRNYFNITENVLSTFQQQSNSSNGSSPRIISNPISKFDASSDSSTMSKGENFSNHYLVSEDVSQMPFGHFNTANMNNSRQSHPIRYNMTTDHSPSSNLVFHNSFLRKSDNSMHNQMVKSRIHNKKRNKQSVDGKSTQPQFQ